METIDIIRIKNKVREFQVRTHFGRTDEDSFTPWWLQQKFKLSDEEAGMLCSDGNFDFGLDGFHIKEYHDKTVLSLVQGKFTADINQIRKGVNDINRFIPNLSKIFKGLESDNFKENILIRRLRPRIEKIEISDNKLLEIHAYVICLSDLSFELLDDKVNTNKVELRKTFEKEIDNPNIVFSSLKILGLDDLTEKGITIVRPARPFSIYFNGSDEIDMGESVFLSGLGKLSDLVELYEQKGNQLFDKNVRLFLYGKKNEKGPAGKIKETLDLINTGKSPAEKFAFLHNGVTIYSTKIVHRKDERKIEVTNPSILNGCQTIKSASFFWQDAKSKGKLNVETWKNIPISIRVVKTLDDVLWREVAEANNRQNSMTAAALRANDEIQIKLENGFKDLKIFYERQESAFDNISRGDDRDNFEEKYANSTKESISIESLAQTIVCSSDMALSYATRQNEIFESHKLYLKVFSNAYLENLPYLVFAHNVRRVMEYAINNAIPENSQKYADLKGYKYRDLFTRLILKVIWKNNRTDLIEEYCGEVINARGILAKNLKEELRRIIKSQDTPILQLVGEFYWDSEKLTWKKQGNQELHTIITNKLKLSNVDIFRRVAEEL